jgi:DSF synthase
MSTLLPELEEIQKNYKQMVTRFDPAPGIMWTYFDSRPRPCVTPDLLREYLACQRLLKEINTAALESDATCPVRFLILASRTEGIYSLGGDLQLFKQCIENQDRDRLMEYALGCIEALHLMSNNLFLPLTTISLVQGEALGGGFEAALSCSVIVAEKGARFGFPEVLFNLFPGMGAYSFLARRIGAAKAERIIMSGSIYTAEYLHEQGVIDILADDGKGEGAVHTYVEKHMRRPNSYAAIYQARKIYHPVTRAELDNIAEVWVESAMRIGKRDLRIMEMLVKSQDRLRSNGPASVRPLVERVLAN